MSDEFEYPRWYTLQAFADERGVSLSTVKNWCKDPKVLRKEYIGPTDALPRISGAEARRFDTARLTATEEVR